MNGGTFAFATSTPCSAPQAVPVTKLIRMPTRITGQPALYPPWWTMYSAASTPDRMSTEPLVRSIPPVMMT